MSIPSDSTQAQRDMLLDLACKPPGAWSGIRGNPLTVASLRRRGLVETRGDHTIRLAHNSNNQVMHAARNGGAPV